VNRKKAILSLALSASCLASARPAVAQSSFYQQIRAHNSAMTAVQPSWMAPLCQTDSRLGQGIKFSVANLRAPGMQQIIYGNNHGFSTIVGNRFQLDFDPPSWFRNHSATLNDGFGNAAAQVKVRIASGAQNGYLSSVYFPRLGAGRAFGRFNVQTMLDGSLPTGKIAAQGRAIDWNVTAQLHPNLHVWLDLENNATFIHAGPFDGATQNFVTPAAFYMVRRRSWGPTHALLTFDAGMQIATTRFHYYNHNLITEIRVGF
jgi:hypothetical protein